VRRTACGHENRDSARFCGACATPLVTEPVCSSCGAADTSDRARKAVTSRIRESSARITTEHPALGIHLENAIRTGVFCSYRPERSPDWNC